MASTDQLRQRRVAPNASIESGTPKPLKIKKRSVVNDADLIFYVFAIGTSAAGTISILSNNLNCNGSL